MLILRPFKLHGDADTEGKYFLATLEVQDRREDSGMRDGRPTVARAAIRSSGPVPASAWERHSVC